MPIARTGGVGAQTYTVTNTGNNMVALQTQMEAAQTAVASNNFSFTGGAFKTPGTGSTQFDVYGPTIVGSIPASGNITLTLLKEGTTTNIDVVSYFTVDDVPNLGDVAYRFTTSGAVITDAIDGGVITWELNNTADLVSTVGPKTYLTLREGDRLIIDGELNHNTEAFTLVDENILTNSNDPAPIYVTANGTWNFGIIENNGLTGQGNTYTTSVGYIAANQSTEVRATLFARTPGVGGMINARGTINFNGGDMEGFVQIGVDGGSLISNAPSKLIIGDLDPPQTAFNGYVQRFATWDAGTDTTVDISDVDIFGGIVNVGRRAFDTPIEANRQRGDIGYLWQHIDNILSSTSAPGVDYPVFRNINFRNNLVDAACYSETSGISGAKLQNIEQGTDIYYTCGRTDVGARNSGFTWFTKELDIDLVNSAGQRQQGVFWIRDTDNPGTDRASLTATGVIGREGPTNSAGVSYSAFNNNADITYRGIIHPTDPFVYTVDTTTKLGELTQQAFTTDGTVEVVLGASDINPNATGASSFARSDRQTGIWRLDLRGKNATYGDDKFDMHMWSYENNYVGREIDLSGTGAFELRQDLSIDNAVTKTRSEITTLNTALGSSGYASTSNSVLYNHAGLTLDDLYDIPKFRKETVAAEIEHPNSSSLFCTSTDGILDFGNYTLNLFAGNKISIGTTHTGIKHSTQLDLSEYNIVDGMSFEAPTLDNVSTLIADLGTVKLIGGTAVMPINANTNWDVSSSDISELTVNVNIADGVVLSVYRELGSSFAAVNNTGSGTVQYFDFPLSYMTATIPADVPSCWYHLSTSTDTDGIGLKEGFHTMGTETNLFPTPNIQNDEVNATTYEVRLLGKNKYDSTGDGGDANYMHGLFYTTFNNNGELGIGADGFNVTADNIISTRFNDALTRQAEIVDATAVPYSGYTATISKQFFVGDATEFMQITIEGVTTQNEITSAQTLRLLMDASQQETADNKSIYLQLNANNNLEDDDIIYPGSNETIINADNVIITTSANKQFLTSVTAVTNEGNTGIASKTIETPAVTIQLPALAPLDQVASAVDQSDAANGVGYLVGTNTDLGPARDEKVVNTNYRGNN